MWSRNTRGDWGVGTDDGVVGEREKKKKEWWKGTCDSAIVGAGRRERVAVDWTPHSNALGLGLAVLRVRFLSSTARLPIDSRAENESERDGLFTGLFGFVGGRGLLPPPPPLARLIINNIGKTSPGAGRRLPTFVMCED